jgi:hypothetical protein
MRPNIGTSACGNDRREETCPDPNASSKMHCDRSKGRKVGQQAELYHHAPVPGEQEFDAICSC